jgi:hypothetical protein
MNRRALLALPLLLLATPIVMRADEATLAGNWILKIVSPQGTRTPSMMLAQDGSVLTGHYKGMRAEAPIAGTIHGNAFELTVKLEGQGATLIVQYKGTVTGDTMAGKVIMGQLGEADFTGARSK